MKTVQNTFAYFQTTTESSHWTDLLQRVDPAKALKKRAAVAKMIKAYYSLSTAAKAEFIRQLNNVNHSNYAVRTQTLDAVKDVLKRVKALESAENGCPMCGYVAPVA
jgi:hypothetical protein